MALVVATIGAPVDASGTTAGAGAEPDGAGTRASACTETPFSAGFDAAVRARWPGKRITAAVYDTRTGCQYRYRGDLRITTASVLKIEVMAAVLLRAQREGRGLTSRERSLIGPMIRTSDDPSTNALYRAVGGRSALTALDRELGLNETVQATPWGLTSTSAADRNRLLRALLLGELGPFTSASRATARAFLLDVTPSQRWGITSGVPANWRVPLKNGFFPSQCCRWRTNSSGVVERPDGSAYVATILSDGWATEAQGIEAVQYVSRAIASWTLSPIGPHLSPARFVQQGYRDVLGRSASFIDEQVLAGWMANRPDRAGQVLRNLLARPEVDVTSGRILRLYLGALKRLPEASTWSGRLNQVRSGERTITQLADSLAWSREFNGPSDLSTADFVDRAYLRASGRSPSSADRAWWTARIDGGRPRGELLVILTSTNTFRWFSGRTVQITSTYLAIVRRLPAPSALRDWEARLNSGRTVSDLAGGLFTSATYRSRFG